MKIEFSSIAVLLIANIVLVTGLFFPNTAVIAEPDFVLALASEPDDVFVSAINGDYGEGDDASFLGTLTVLNDQNIPVPKAIVTIQLVINNRTSQIDQFTTNEDGVADYEFELDGIVPLWVEVLDILGDGVDYAPSKNVKKVFNSAEIDPV
jgi:hypothetical protein